MYIDDIIVNGKDDKEMNLIRELMAKEFEVKNLGVLGYFLGMEFARSKQDVFVFKRSTLLIS